MKIFLNRNIRKKNRKYFNTFEIKSLIVNNIIDKNCKDCKVSSLRNNLIIEEGEVSSSLWLLGKYFEHKYYQPFLIE